jgi:chromatin assembly factor 1 subunit B
MKVETPQILWNNEAEKGKNAPLLSIDMTKSGIVAAVDPHSSSSSTSSPQNYSHVLVTAGNATSINLWKVSFGQDATDNTNNKTAGIFQKQTRPLNKIDYMMSLTRHDTAVNTVAFSPDGLHLATAGDSGSIVVWSVPINKRGNNNGRHFWSTLTKENELTVRIVSTHCEGIVDLSWSEDSKRFAVGTIDSCLLIYEDRNYGFNSCNPETHQKESEWSQVFRNAEHGAFVQGVAYDPKGVYVATMGSDRTVRVFPRKTPPKSKKKVLRPANTAGGRMVTPPLDHQRMVAQILTDSKIEIGKIKRIKQRVITTMEEESSTSTTKDEDTEQDQQQPTQQRQIKQKLFVDESNCESFFRRLSWTSDGAFLVTPAALWHADNDPNNENEDSSSPSFSTYLFARHRFDEPYRVLPGLDKPSVVVRPNPVLFELPPAAIDDSKENQSPMRTDQNGDDRPPSATGLPYRSVFAVLTLDSIFVYDTHHVSPLSVIQGLHYSGLTDCCWSQDGMNLLVCSSDGYISIVNFADGEFGTVYKLPCSDPSEIVASTQNQSLAAVEEIEPPVEVPPLPPCETGPANVLLGPAPKRAKKTRITPTLVSSVPTGSANIKAATASSNLMTSSSTSKRGISDTETETVGAAVTKLSLDTNNAATSADNTSGGASVGFGEKPKKKKKRVQPLLISSNN